MKNYKVEGVVVDNDIPVNTYGVDLADEMTKILSEQLVKEIDRDILRSLGIEPDKNKRRKNSINKIYKNDCRYKSNIHV